MTQHSTAHIPTAKDLGLITCRRCSRVWPAPTQECGRCGHPVQSRDPLSLQRVWAFWIVGFMCYIPANIFPMLQTRTLLSVQEDTIIGGAVELFHYGSPGIAGIILFASVVIPVAKFLAVGFLAISVTRPSRVSPHHRTLLFEVVEYIGRWSMIDIFVVAIMASLVQLNTLAAITPGIASLFFALSVIFTMLSAQAFDSRMIWDAQAEAIEQTPEHDTRSGARSGSKDTSNNGPDRTHNTPNTNTPDAPLRDSTS